MSGKQVKLCAGPPETRDGPTQALYNWLTCSRNATGPPRVSGDTTPATRALPWRTSPPLPAPPWHAVARGRRPNAVRHSARTQGPSHAPHLV